MGIAGVPSDKGKEEERLTQVRDIEKSETLPGNEDWVLIEATDGKFVASGSLTTIDGPAFFKPAPFVTRRGGYGIAALG
jgi:hypothetical protein